MNVKEFREKANLTQQELSNLTGIPRDRIASWENGRGNPKAEDSKILTNFFVNKITNNPTLLVEKDIIINRPTSPSKRPKNPVKFIDVDFLAGNTSIEFYDDNNMVEVAYEMDIPEFAGCTAFRAYSDSMEPLIKSGSILFGTKIEDWNDHLEFGQIYGVVCTNGRRYLKYIRKHPNEMNKFILRSENIDKYDDFDLPKKSIKSIWLINGWLNKRT